MRYRDASRLPAAGLWTTIPELCAQAGIQLQAVAPWRRILVYTGDENIRTPDVDAVGVPVADLASPEAALRALEALAHGFHDHAARACVCRRGLFGPPDASLGYAAAMITASEATKGT